MQRRRLRAGVVLLLAVAGLGAAGAAVEQQGGGSGSTGVGGGTSSGAGDGDSPGFLSAEDIFHPLFSGDIVALALGVLALAGAVVGVAYVVLTVLELDWSKILAVLRSAAGKVVVAVFLVVLLYFLVQLFGGTGGGGGAGLLDGESEGVSDTASDSGVELPATIGIAVVALVVLVVLVAGRRSNDDGDDVAQAAPESGGEAAISTGGSPGGTDVGRPPADNEVYRAWLSLAEAADADPRRATPERVADEAVGQGIDEEAAREITSLFESVRYGRRDLDDGLERRARRARGRLTGES